MNIAAYCRVSTEKEDQLNSLEAQKNFFKEYTDRSGDRLVRLYADEGLSGTKIKNRKQFLKMMTDAESGLFDMVVVKDISRFARNTVDLLQNIRKLKSLGIETQFLTANMTSMGNSEFVLTVFGALAQEESANTSKRVKFGKKINAEKGRVPNIVFGYDKTIGDYFNLTINKAEADVVRRIYRWYLNEGYGAAKIAAMLNARGIKTKRGCEWSQNAVCRILENELYTGKIVNGKEEVSDFLTGKRTLKNEDEWYVADRPDLRIISDESAAESTNVPGTSSNTNTRASSTVVTSSASTSKPSKTYGFSENRFGAAGTKFKVEKTSMGKYPYPSEMMNFTEVQIDEQKQKANKLLASIREAKANGTNKVYVEPGYYRFGSKLSTMLLLDGLQNFEIIGGPGVHFIQEKSDTVIKLNNCKNVTLKGVTVDYANLKFIQATIQRFDQSGDPIVKIDDNYKSIYENIASKLSGNRIIYFDGDDLTKELVSSNTTGFLKEMVSLGNGEYKVTYSDNNTLTMTPKISVSAGDKMVIFQRGDPHAVVVAGCENVTLEDIDIYASGSFGISECDGIGGNTYRRIRMIRRPGTDRLVCTSGDGFHSTNMKKGALIEKCEFSYTEDDLMNVHCFNGVVTKVYSDTEYEITFPLTTYLDANTEITFIKGATATTVTATKVTRITDSAVIDEYKSLDQTIFKAIGRTIRTFNTPSVYRIKLNKAVTASMYSEVTSVGYSSAGLTVRDCYFHDAHGNGFLATGPNVTVKNNRFERIAGAAITMLRGGIWSEGPYPTKTTIENNIFKENNNCFEAQYRPGVIIAQCDAKGLIHDITIRNNEFVGNRVGAFFAQNVSNVTFTGNTVKNYLTTAPFDHAKNLAAQNGVGNSYCGLYIDRCDNVTVKSNTFSGKGTYAQEDIRITSRCTNVQQ